MENAERIKVANGISKTLSELGILHKKNKFSVNCEKFPSKSVYVCPNGNVIKNKRP